MLFTRTAVKFCQVIAPFCFGGGLNNWFTEDIVSLRVLTWNNMVCIPWKRGDLLLVDNYRISHGEFRKRARYQQSNAVWQVVCLFQENEKLCWVHQGSWEQKCSNFQCKCRINTVCTMLAPSYGFVTDEKIEVEILTITGGNYTVASRSNWHCYWHMHSHRQLVGIYFWLIQHKGGKTSHFLVLIEFVAIVWVFFISVHVCRWVSYGGYVVNCVDFLWVLNGSKKLL